MDRPSSASRNPIAPSVEGCVLAFLGQAGMAIRRSFVFVLFITVCLGLASESFARCGGSVKYMAWKNSSNAELIRLDHSVFVPVAGSKVEQSSGMASALDHDQDQPCTTCRCKNEKDTSTPIETIVSESSTNTLCRFAEISGAVDRPGMESTLLCLSEMVLCPSLGLMERPPRF